MPYANFTLNYTKLYWAIRLYGSLLTPTRQMGSAKDKCPCFLPSSISLQSSNQITRIGCASEMLMLWKVLSCNATNSACFCRYTRECIHFIVYICISFYMNDASDIFIPCKNSRCSSVFYEPQKVIPDGPPQSSCKQASRTFTNLKLSWQVIFEAHTTKMNTGCDREPTNCSFLMHYVESSFWMILIVSLDQGLTKAS